MCCEHVLIYAADQSDERIDYKDVTGLVPEMRIWSIMLIKSD